MDKKFSFMCILITLSSIVVPKEQVLIMPEDTSEDKYWIENPAFHDLCINPKSDITTFIIADFIVDPIEKTLTLNFKTRYRNDQTKLTGQTLTSNNVDSDVCIPFEFKVSLSDYYLANIKQASDLEKIQIKKRIINELYLAFYEREDLIIDIKNQVINTNNYTMSSYRLFNNEFRAMKAIKLNNNKFFNPKKSLMVLDNQFGEEDWS